MTDYTTLITSEHTIRPKFLAVVQALANGLGDVSTFTQALPAQFDVDFAIGAQLDVVGQWVGQPRLVPNVLLPLFFGFSDNVAALTFGEASDVSIGGKFWEWGTKYASTVALDDAAYRRIIYAKIASNQSNGSAATLAGVIATVFGGAAAIQDTGTFSISITVGSPVTQLDQALINQARVLPIPAGVALAAIHYKPALTGAAVSTVSATGAIP